MRDSEPAPPDIEEVMEEGATKPPENASEHDGIRVGPVHRDQQRSASMEAQPRTPPKKNKTPKKQKMQKTKTKRKQPKKTKYRKHERSNKPTKRNIRRRRKEKRKYSQESRNRARHHYSSDSDSWENYENP